MYWAHELPGSVPLLILHGASDWRVKPEQSMRMTLECDKYRIPYRLVIYEGGDHGISERKEEVMEQSIAWFDRFVKNGEELPNMEFHGR
ncbi:MAG: prolyl oligopeptidase family serine peptidase [Flavobacteriales bacterium]|nr:prolyl oligopeptidase family serine peptidase [Flavobacteriales bacterium]